jgi:hypothetical protein
VLWKNPPPRGLEQGERIAQPVRSSRREVMHSGRE